jgi:hypothetical protein
MSPKRGGEAPRECKMAPVSGRLGQFGSWLIRLPLRLTKRTVAALTRSEEAQVVRVILVYMNGLRHQLAAYRRTVTRPKLRTTDRLFWVWLVGSS